MSKQRTLKLGETLKVTFDFSQSLEVPWRNDFQYALLEFITIGALVYECTNAGKTGSELPENLSTTIGATQDDGTVQWTVRDFSANGSDTISTRTVTSSSGITIDSSAIVKDTYVDVTFTADTIGAQSITCEIVTDAGEPLKHKENVFIE